MAKEERESRKKKWATPQLIVLVRGRPEEKALAGFGDCKNNCEVRVPS